MRIRINTKHEWIRSKRDIDSATAKNTQTNGEKRALTKKRVRESSQAEGHCVRIEVAIEPKRINAKAHEVVLRLLETPIDVLSGQRLRMGVTSSLVEYMC